MSAFNPYDFPRPVITAELDFQSEKGKILQDEVNRLQANGMASDTINIQADVLNIGAEAGAARDVYWIARLNDAVRVVHLSEFAEGADLDLKVQRSGIKRLTGETDQALRKRERIAQKGKSSGGPDDYYKDRALGVDARVRDVQVFGETRNITERWLVLSVLTHDNGGIADAALLERILTSCNERSFKRSFVHVEVVSAVIAKVNVSAVITYYPATPFPSGESGLSALLAQIDHPDTQIEALALKALIKARKENIAGTEQEISQKAQGLKMAAQIRKQSIADQKQGFDLTRSYLERHLHTAGTQKVELPGWIDRFAASNEAFSLGDINVHVERALT